MQSRHEPLTKFLGVGRHIFLVLYNCCVLHSFLGLHSLGMLVAVHQNIEAARPASSYASAAVEPLDDAVCHVLHFPHVLVVQARSQEFWSEVFLAGRLTGVLPPHQTLYLCGTLPQPARRDISSPVVRGATFKKTSWIQPMSSIRLACNSIRKLLTKNFLYCE